MSNAKRRFTLTTRLGLCMLALPLALSACRSDGADAGESDAFDAQVADYIRKFPYQDTHEYMMKYTQGEPSKLNTWVIGAKPSLVKAGDDKVVRMNNDTFYKMAFIAIGKGPVTIASTSGTKDRFSSFQLMDDRNANYRNIIHPQGTYTLYRGEKPAALEGEAIEVPSSLSVIIVRVEVRDKNDAEDVAAAETVFDGITINGPTIEKTPELDVLSGFDKKVATEALRRIDNAFSTAPFSDTVVGPGQEPGKDVPYLNHAAGTKGGWGGPDPAHSAYQLVFHDQAGAVLDGSKGTYTITTAEPAVQAFWSVTVYDTARGGYLHPNKDDRYHINNTVAVKNENGTVTFTFKRECEPGDKNCLEVPAGPFDLAVRYYLPSKEIQSGKWTMPLPKLAAK